MEWVLFHPHAVEMMGYLPGFISNTDPRPARDQLDASYSHAGGWRPMQGWSFDPFSMELSYPGDPVLEPLAMTMLRDDAVFVFRHAWVVIYHHADNSFEVARMD